MRRGLVEHHVVEWLVLQLGDPESLSAAMLEACAGLLMNLSLTPAGRQHCAEVHSVRPTLAACRSTPC